MNSATFSVHEKSERIHFSIFPFHIKKNTETAVSVTESQTQEKTKPTESVKCCKQLNQDNLESTQVE